MRVLILSRYGRLGASSRVRLLQYIPYLESKGWKIDVRPLFSDDYLRSLYSSQSRIVSVIAGYWRRIKVLTHARKYDLIWLEKEIFPFAPALAERLLNKLGVRYVVDYDDALFHRYDMHRSRLIRSLLGHKIDTVMKHATLVVAGNEYLAERARTANSRRVEIVPTVVDMTRYKVAQQEGNRPLVVGWIGSLSTSYYLSIIATVIESLKRDFDVRFVAVGADVVTLKGIPIEVLPWSEETEVQAIQMFDIGIMPLRDSPWERGKCGYKLVQYMACGLPVVASPVGVNNQLVEHGVNGFLADDEHDWVQALQRLLGDQDLRHKMGTQGRKRVEIMYSLQAQAPIMDELLRGALR
ncbi:MAG TPA: glycosyltransferase [Gammaproteobacteria bacterium]|nr:glycosyltransferase [Gammaproteobacteria bacterium]